MGRDIVETGLLGILAVVLVMAGYGLVVLATRYRRGRGYELEHARHTYGTETYATVTIPRASVAGRPPWAELEPLPAPLPADLEPRWASDMERAGEPLPAWADPEADRVTAFGMGSGSSGSDYGKTPPRGAWPAPADNGTGDAGRVTRGRGSEAYGPPAPAPASPWADDEDGPLGKTWARLEQAWADGTGAPSADPGSKDAPTSPVAAGVVPVTGRPGPGNSHGPGGVLAAAAASPGPGWAPTKLGTLFDAVMAAEVSAYIQDQNRDVTEYLEQLLGIRW